MTDATHCPACGCELPVDAPAGLCPKCLLAAGFESRAPGDPQLAATTPPPSSGAMRFIPPAIDELNRQLPQYEFLELLGQGGMGAVYKARQKGLDRLVAVKILPTEVARDAAFAERFAREARALAKLSHPNIVGVYDFGRTGKGIGERGQETGNITAPSGDSPSAFPLPPSPLFYIVMEFVDGVNLRQAIRTKSMKPEQALAVVPQICDALQYAHDEGVVHRDIKPENILVDKRGRVKIADFGLAKLLGGEPFDTALTGTHQVMGTLRYMAPEQLEGTHDVDHRADIYSLGVVFYELLTGELPLGRFAPPSKKVQIDVRLDEVVLRALEKEPELRWQHASDVKTELTAIVDSAGGTISRVPAAMLGREYRSRSTLFGLPWLHVAFGLDPATGKKRVARGIVAVGDIAKGVFAMGGVAYGVVCCGGTAIGLLSCGGLSFGLLISVGGVAVGGFAWGGLAAGAVAIGGLALGGYAFGGLGYGGAVLASNAQDPAAKQFFEPWAYRWPLWMTWLCVGVPAFNGILFVVSSRLLRKQDPTAAPTSTSPKAPSNSEPRFSRAALLGACWAPFFLLALAATMGVYTVQRGDGSAPAVPLMIVVVIAGFVTLLGVAAPFGTTILGGVAVSQIRRSERKLYGLPLAVGDMLLFPLLLLDVLIVASVGYTAGAIYDSLSEPHSRGISWATVSLFALPIIAWVDYRIVRAVWRSVSDAKPTGESRSEPAAKKPPTYTRYVIVPMLVLSCLFLAAAYWATIRYGQPGPGYQPIAVKQIQIWGVGSVLLCFPLLLLLRWMHTLPSEAYRTLRSRLLITTATFALGAAAILAYFISPWNQPHVESHGVTFISQSGRFEKLSLGVNFLSYVRTEGPYFDPDRCEIHLQLHQTGDVLFRATYLEFPGFIRIDGERREPLDRERFLKWLRNPPDFKPEMQAEVDELFQFLNQFQDDCPQDWETFIALGKTYLKHYRYGEDLGTRTYVRGNPHVGFLYAIGTLVGGCLIATAWSIRSARQAIGGER